MVKVQATQLSSMQEETRRDPVLRRLRHLIMDGWPESMQDLDPDLHHYWPHRDELAVHDGIILKGSRIIVPSSMRQDQLEKLHDGHQGQSGTLRRARQTLYWPKIQDDIQDMIARCEDCQKNGKNKPRVPQRQIQASEPMEIIAGDVMDFHGQPVLVQVDYYSGYFMHDALSSQTSSSLITRCNDNYRRFGTPRRLITDNATAWKSEKFRAFCEKLGIHHDTSSPHYHQSNGRVERAIQTIRQIFEKCKNDIEVTNAVLSYLDTPIDNELPSPGQLFFNRRLNTRLTMYQYNPNLDDDLKQKLSDKRAAHLKPRKSTAVTYHPDQAVWYTDDNSSDWKQGIIDEKDLHPDSYWLITENNTRVRRNTHDIKPRVPVEKTEPPRKMYQAPELRQKPSPPVVTDTPTVKHTDPPAAEPEVETPPSPVKPAEEADREDKTEPRRSTRARKSTKDPNFVYKCTCEPE